MKPVLLCLGSGGLADAAILAAMLRLLARGALGPARLLAASPRTWAGFAPGIPVLPDNASAQALLDSTRLIVAGPLRTPAAVVRAARHVVQASQAGVPASLAAVHLPAAAAQRSAGAALRILAHNDSISAGDSVSARALSCWRGRRVECTAPVELLLEVPTQRDSAAFTLTVEAGVLARAGPALGEALQVVSRAWQARVCVLHSRLSRRSVSSPAPWRDIAASDLFVGAANAALLHVAAAHGAVPVALVSAGGHSDVHARLALEHLTQTPAASRDAWVRTFEQARSLDLGGLRCRMATLRVVAWRTLGILAEATRSVPLPLNELDADCHAFLAAMELPALRGSTLDGDASRQGAPPVEPGVPVGAADPSLESGGWAHASRSTDPRS